MEVPKTDTAKGIPVVEIHGGKASLSEPLAKPRQTSELDLDKVKGPTDL